MTNRDSLGHRITLEMDGARAEVGTVAAVLRSLSVAGGVHLTEPNDGADAPAFGNGTVLVPWPNRVRDGKWMLEGEIQQLDITETARGNALHGLLRFADYEIREQTASSVLLGALVAPQHGWPFLLDTWVRYELRADGLTVTHGVANLGEHRAPYAVGTHPFLRVGDVPVDQLVLTLAASTYFDVDDRLNPIGELAVDGTRFDLREGLRVGDLDLDTAFGGVTLRDGASAWLTAPDGSKVELVQDVDWGYLQVFTPGDVFPKDGGAGYAIAVEPMTAPPDALNSGQGLQWIEPGATSEGSWGLRYIPGGGTA
ncbi:MAG: aldose 1-epimerase family protein [Pseudolysinimonas sp.]|uniref:aldose 1-epimerase family protein n=1 Tax=Pseudolysinimonas sp. TaxID=2680009 RepID=UPI003263B24C